MLCGREVEAAEEHERAVPRAAAIRVRLARVGRAVQPPSQHPAAREPHPQAVGLDVGHGRLRASVEEEAVPLAMRSDRRRVRGGRRSEVRAQPVGVDDHDGGLNGEARAGANRVLPTIEEAARLLLGLHPLRNRVPEIPPPPLLLQFAPLGGQEDRARPQIRLSLPNMEGALLDLLFAPLHPVGVSLQPLQDQAGRELGLEAP
mmetsp:Transcript_2386/g.7887  ORF Transcript_2386/g.7887 Transcript_2386/m.7887 type:complete len:203 (-) Transcript_2386:722-1330(-)